MHVNAAWSPYTMLRSRAINHIQKKNNKRTDRYTEGKKKKKVKKKIERTNNEEWDLLLVGVNEYVMGKIV